MKDFLAKHTEALILSALAVFAPIKGMIIVAALAIVVDFITGILAARKRKQKIESNKMGTTVSRLLITQAAIMMSYLVQTHLLQNEFPLVNWIAGVVGIKEIYSIMENLNTISGNNLFTEILSKMSSINYKKDEKKEEPKDPSNS